MCFVIHSQFSPFAVPHASHAFERRKGRPLTSQQLRAAQACCCSTDCAVSLAVVSHRVMLRCRQRASKMRPPTFHKGNFFDLNHTSHKCSNFLQTLLPRSLNSTSRLGTFSQATTPTSVAVVPKARRAAAASAAATGPSGLLRPSPSFSNALCEVNVAAVTK